MLQNEWLHIEGSVYISEKPMENVDIAFLLDGLKESYPYMEKCIKNIHQADISNIHSLDFYFDYDGTPGKFAQK